MGFISYIDNVDNMHKRDKSEDKSKTKVELDTDVVNKLIPLKKVGDSYSDVIRRLLHDK